MSRNKQQGLVLSKKNARHIGVFERYSQLTRVPMDELIEEAWSEYLAANPAKS